MGRPLEWLREIPQFSCAQTAVALYIEIERFVVFAA